MDESLLTAKSIVQRAQEICDEEKRRAYLNQACENNAELRQHVESLLRAEEELDRCPDRAAATLDTKDVSPGQWLDPKALPSAPLEGVGSRIGPYKLLQQIGEGGMGVVFMAEQQEPVRRMVALKIIKAGMDSAQVIARFEAERQALALMDHPNIAKVLDANTTATGRPYFVMELVKGIAITKYCDEQRLSLRQRLELFIPVCQAIQHAHQKGIIHRDIKPSNVLIAAYDGKPVPKIIDFGVAKAMGQKLTERTLFTGFGGIIGTLEYMSPEQAEFNALDIDTRSDVYSLGVLLYELLTGTTPLTRQRLKDAAFTEVLRLIREEEPPRPSTRLSATRDSLASVSAQRHMEPSALVKAVRGEVDWIVMKALEKDRTRRYETAIGLARDIQRFLTEEPVEAGPPSATYRLRKLAWKHRRGLATAMMLLLLLVGGVVVSSSLAVRASRAEKEAVDERNRALAAEAEAKEQRDKALAAEQASKRSEEDAKAVLEFFQDKVLSAGRPEGQQGGLGNNVTLRKAVDAAEPEIAKAFADRPLVEASIRNTLALTYRYLGDYPQAIRQDERALELRESKLGPDHSDTLTVRNNLANTYLDVGRLGDAVRLHEQTLKQREAKLGTDHPATLLSRGNLAEAYRKAGRTQEAIGLLEQNVKLCQAKLGPDDPDTLHSQNSLAVAYWSAGRTKQAIALHERTLKLMEAKLGPDHPDTLLSRNNLAVAYSADGRTDDAIHLHEQALKQREAKLGPDHPATLDSRTNLAENYRAAGRTADAIRLLEQTLKLSEAKFGPDDPRTLHARNNLAETYRSAGRADEAIRLFKQNFASCEAKVGADHPQTLSSRNNLATAHWSAGHFDDAIRLHEQNLKLCEAKLGPDHPQTLNSRNNLATAYWSAGRTADAIGLHEQNVKLSESKLGPNHPNTLSSRNNLAEAYRAAGRTSDAIGLLEQTLKQQEAKIGTDHPDTLTTRNNLAAVYRDTGRTADAIRLFEQNVKLCEASLGANHPHTLQSYSSLAETYDRAEEFAKAESLYRQVLEHTRQRFGADDAKTAGQMALLGTNLLHQHKYTDAEPLLRDCLKIREAKQPDSWTTFNARSLLGAALLGQKKYADAEPLLLSGYQGMKQRDKTIPPQGKLRPSEALERLVQLYEATGKKDDAEKWRKERAERTKKAGKETHP